VRVNLIRSILVFREKKYCVHDNEKLVFLKINIQKLYTIKKKATRTVQVNCTVPVNSAIHLHCLRAKCNELYCLCAQCK
jgi:hypothetical protein